MRTLNFPILFYLAVDVRLRHSKRLGGLSLTESTQRAWRSLPRGFGWDGAADHVHEVFKRKVTDSALVVPDMDPFVDVYSNGALSAKNSSKTASQAQDEAAAASASASESQSRSTTASKAINPRLGTLASPLAKIFGADAGKVDSGQQGGGNRSKMRASANEKSAFVSADVINRLEAIEQALAVLVGEVAKSSAGPAEGKDEVPMTSLTGQREQSYADAE